MASGKVHARDSTALAAGAVLVTVLCPARVTLPIAAGALSGVILTPDLDIEDWIRAKWLLIARVPVLGYAFAVCGPTGNLFRIGTLSVTRLSWARSSAPCTSWHRSGSVSGRTF